MEHVFFFIVTFYLFNLYEYLLNRLQYLAFDEFLTPGINLPVCQFESNARIRLNSALMVGCLTGFLAALSKVFRKA